MIHPTQQSDGKKLLHDGWSDEDVERLTGLTLASIILMRAEAASAACDHRAIRQAAQNARHEAWPSGSPPPRP